MKKYDEASVIKTLNKKGSVNVDTINKVVEIVKDSNDVGNGTWGRIDYLCHYHNYCYVFVTNLSRKKIIKVKLNDDEPVITKGKHFNMSTMVKENMKKMK